MSNTATAAAKKVAKGTEKAKELRDAQVARYAAELQKKHGNFRSVPGFSEYEISADGNCLRSRKTGKQQVVPTGKRKYFIFNDKGERRSIGKDEILALLPTVSKASAKKEKAAKTTKERKPRNGNVEVTGEDLEALKNNSKVKNILKDGGKKHLLCFKLHSAGFTTPQIMALTGCPYNATKRNIWYYDSGQKTL